MHTVFVVFAVIGAAAVAFCIFGAVQFARGVNKNGWNQ